MNNNTFPEGEPQAGSGTGLGWRFLRNVVGNYKCTIFGK
jgi:hypothetical protein